ESEVHSRDGNDKIVESSVSTVKDLTEGCVNTNSMVNSNRSVKLPLYREPIPHAIRRKHWKNVKLGIRDDDENSFWCSKYSTRVKPHRPQSCIGQRRIKKVSSTSKYWKAAPKLNDYELYTTNEGMKAFHRYRKSIYERERCQNPSLKKPKLSDRRFAVAYDSDIKHSISDIRQQKGTAIEFFFFFFANLAADVASDCMKVHSKAKDHVAFSIKSFKVPELYLEVPESATIGSLKRMVLEAITAVLGGGIRVGIVFQGRKIRGDNKTLQQAGISQCSNLDNNLAFTLEPIFARMNRKKIPLKNVVLRSPRSPVTNPDDVSSDDILIDKAVSENMALVPVSPMKEEALAAVPVNQKPIKGAADASQRRTRRPFSVAEVEVLVEAVEKLGTGRWRDVKTLAFENADHRTYVDLKDKWKTLVHTATISPQQRRGEPVPHELLSRVLSAH
ncbi:hypothetical protein M569_12958, partial [Genlisea aurea]